MTKLESAVEFVRQWLYRLGEPSSEKNWAPPKVVNACCGVPRNLMTIERRKLVQVRRCKVCGKRHFRAFMPLPSGEFRVNP